MTGFMVGKILMTISAVMFGIIPVFVDLNKTHATNPLWISHARFHVVWQVIMTFLISILSLYLIWGTSGHFEGLLISFCLGLTVLGSFFINILLMKYYKGTLSDEGGVPKISNVNANLVAFTFEIILLIIGYLMVVL